MKLRTALLASTLLAGSTINSWAQVSTANMGISKQETQPRLWVLDPTQTWIPMMQMDPVTHTWSMYASQGLSVNAASLKADGYWGYNDATYTSGGVTLTSAARNCSLADVGKVVVAAGGGVSGAPYHGHVTGCNGNAYTLDTSFGASLSATPWALGTDNSAALSVVLGDGSGTSQCVYLPAGLYLLDAVSVKMSNNCLRGQGVLASRISSAVNLASYGTTIMLASPTVSPLTTTYTTTIEGVNFFWPGQFPLSSASVPYAYPPLLSPLAGNPSSDLYFNHNTVLNAYDIFKQQLTDGVLGNLRMQDDILVGFHSVWDVNAVGEEIWTADNIINTGAYGAIGISNGYAFYKWALQNGSFLIAEGNGVGGGNCNTRGTYGVNISHNVINGYARVIYIPTGWLDETHIDGNDINGNNQILQVDAGGVIRGLDFKGLLLGGQSWVTVGTPIPTLPLFNFLGTCTNTNTSEINIHGRVTGNNIGGALYFGGTQGAIINMSGEFGLMALTQPALTQSTYFGIIDSPNAKVNISGSWFWNKLSVSSGVINNAYYNGFLVKQATSFNFSGSIADSWNSIVDLSQLSTPSAVINVDVVTTNTLGANAVVLPTTCNNVHIGGVLDKQATSCWPVTLTYPTTSWTPPAGFKSLDVTLVGPSSGGGGGAMTTAGTACSGGAGSGGGAVVFGSFTRVAVGTGALTLQLPLGGLGGAGATTAGSGAAGSAPIGNANFASRMVAGYGGSGSGGVITGTGACGGGGGSTINNGGAGTPTVGGIGSAPDNAGVCAGTPTPVTASAGSGSAGGAANLGGSAGGGGASANGGSGGGGGGGVNAAGTTGYPGQGGGSSMLPGSNNAAGGAVGSNGQNGGSIASLANYPYNRPGAWGGGGGGAGMTGPAGNGGNGSYGGGAGGGGCGLGVPGGNGGTGGAAEAIIWPRF